MKNKVGGQDAPVPIWTRSAAEPAPDGGVSTVDRCDSTRLQEAERALHARTCQQAAMAQLSQLALSDVDVPTLLEEAVIQAVRTLDADFGELFELHPHGLRRRIQSGWSEQNGHATPVSTATLAGHTLLNRESLRIDDLIHDSRFSDEWHLRRSGVVSSMTVLVQGRDEPFGVLLVHSTRAREFTTDELHFLQVVANILAEAIRRWRAEQALRTNEERFRALIENSSDLVCLLDAESTILYVASSLTRVLGYPNDDRWRGRDGLAVVHPEDRERARTLLRDLVQRPARRATMDYRALHADGSWRWMDAVVTNLLEHPSVGGLVVNCRDMTERKLAAEKVRQLSEDLEQRVLVRTAELEAANRELEAFSYSVSHDLRAPLRSIDGFSRILLEEYAEQLTAEATRYLRLVRDNTRQMGRLVDDLLAFSRLSRQALEKRPVDPAVMVRAVLHDLSADRASRQIEIEVGELPGCAADPALFKQAWVNLLSNALKYTRRRDLTRIEVGSMTRGGETIYYVRDNGVGFDMRYADKLFGVFQRLHRAEDYEGTGVGLAIVQRILHRHGGRIWAEAALNEGATFYFTVGGASP